jgi:hypothetical protein
MQEYGDILRIEVQVGPINLVESPQEIFGRPVDIVSAGIVGKVVGKWAPGQLHLEQIDLVQEEDYTGPHKPTAVDNRIEQH